MHTSYSELRDFKTCPKMHALNYGDGKRPHPPEREKKVFAGVIVADTIEQFYKQQWWRDAATAEDKMQAYALERAQGRTRIKGIDWVPTEWEGVTTLIRETLPKAVRVIKAEKLLGARNEVEHESVIVIQDLNGQPHTVHGRLDLIVVKPPFDLTVLDGKMGATVGKFVSPDQLRLYALMVKQEFGVYPKHIGFWWFRHEKIVWKKITEAALIKFKEGVADTLTRLANGEKDPTPGNHCRLCDFRLECAEGRKFLFDKEASRCPLDVPPGQVIFASF